jgi:hypothetical protein
VRKNSAFLSSAFGNLQFAKQRSSANANQTSRVLVARYGPVRRNRNTRAATSTWRTGSVLHEALSIFNRFIQIYQPPRLTKNTRRRIARVPELSKSPVDKARTKGMGKGSGKTLLCSVHRCARCPPPPPRRASPVRVSPSNGFCCEHRTLRFLHFRRANIFFQERLSFCGACATAWCVLDLGDFLQCFVELKAVQR